MNTNNNQFAVKTLTPEEIYTDRQEYLDFFYEVSLKAVTRRSMSTVLLGQRQMGKTEIFRRVVNRLFFEQDYRDDKAVVPVYFSFPDEAISRHDFALSYVENFVKWYAGFKLRKPQLITNRKIKRVPLVKYISNSMPISEGFQTAIELLLSLDSEGGITLPEMEALHLPRRVSDWDDTTIVMFLDEFQNTYLPEYNFRVVGFMQEAVESPTCPHFVTGSAMSILRDEILGRGSLYGRFRSMSIEEMTDYHGAELVLRSSKFYKVEVPELMAPVIARRCGCNPFYIKAVMQQAEAQRASIQDEETLNNLLAIDISNGFIWAELFDQVSRWVAKVNEHGITKRILYLSALETERRINLERIQTELRLKDKREVDIETIQNVLIKLSRGDLIDYRSFGDFFFLMDDPILNEFLKVWGRIVTCGERPTEVKDDLESSYKKLKRQVSEYKGYLAEVFMSQILFNCQRKKLPAKYLHTTEDITVPDFNYIDLRSSMGAGKGLKIDIFGAAGLEVWLGQSKWWSNRKVGADVVKHFLTQVEEVKKRRQDKLDVLRMWLFAHDGITEEAEELIKEHGIFWSARSDLDALIEFANLRKLPVV